MLGTNEVQSETLALGSGLPLARIIGTAVAAFALITAAWYAAQVIVLDHSASAALTVSVAGARAPLRPDASLQITARGAGVDLEGAQLFRADIGADRSQSAEQPVPVRLQPAGDDGTYQVLAASGGTLLDTDGAYRLVVRAAAPRPALPLPRTSFIDQQYRFTTVASPHAQVPSAALQPRWAEPVSFTWSEPMQDVAASIQPAAPIRAWVDSSDATRTWVQIGGDNGAGLTDGQTYDIRVDQAHAVDGYALKQPLSFKVAVPARPSFVDVPSGPVTLHFGDTFTLKSAGDLASADVTTTDGVGARVDVGQRQIQLALPDYQQGAEFDMTVASATSNQGAPLAAPLTIHFVTPPAFAAPSFDPDDGDIGIQPSAHPSVTFAEPVADQTAAAKALSIDPPVAGAWKWTTPDTAVFVPDNRLPLLTNVTLTVRGGPDGPRTASGGYLAGDQSVTFRTTDYKRMEVSLSRQTMTLYENDVAIRTIYVATGVAAAPTPTGTFYVQMKAPQMRFQGFNPDGSHYDIPDVHWVMPFWGDYTIHGAYWRPRFGVPGSDGCVSMTDADAKSVYDWADVGTPIVIHS